MMLQGNSQQLLGHQGGSNPMAGRRRPAHVPNYHTLSNNAVLPTNEKQDVQHYHTKVVRDRNPKLAPTLRPGSNTIDVSQNLYAVASSPMAQQTSIPTT